MLNIFVAAMLSAAPTTPVVAFVQTSPNEALASARPDEWEELPADEVMLIDLPGGRRVAILLAPMFAPAHIGNIRRLVGDGWYPRHAKIVRVQENYVVQWGDPTAAAPLPTGMTPQPAPIYEQPGVPAGFRALPFRDSYAPTVGLMGPWPVATDGRSHWPVHCPGMVGAGRDLPPDAGTGAELYVVIGHGPRHLDRNIALVGRVIEGMEHLSSLPRGTGDLGFYEQAADRVPLVAVRMASSLPVAERPRYQQLRPGSAALSVWIGTRANRRDAFFVRPAGGADVCNLLPPIRRVDQEKMRQKP